MRIRELDIVMVVLLPLIVGLLVRMAITDGILIAIGMGGTFAVFLGPVMFFVYRRHRTQVRELIDSLTNAESGVQNCRRNDR